MPAGGGEDVFSGQDIDDAATLVIGAKKDGEGKVARPVADGVKLTSVRLPSYMTRVGDAAF